MEILDESSAMLSNFEVFTLLQELQAGQKSQKRTSKSNQHLATISYSTLKYLEKMPCQFQTEEIISNFMKVLEPFNLTKAEKLQMLNHRPTSAVEIQLMIEESEERLTEDQIDELLQLITTHLPGPDPPPQEAEEEEEEEMDQTVDQNEVTWTESLQQILYIDQWPRFFVYTSHRSIW